MRWKDHHIEILTKMYNEGKSNAEIAKAVGVSVRAVRAKCISLRNANFIGSHHEAISSVWTPAVYERLHQLWVEEKKTGTQCAVAIGVSRSSVMSAIRRKGWLRGETTHRPVGRKVRAHIADPDAYIVEKFNAGTTISDMARAVGMNASSVRKRLQELGYETSKPKADAVHPMWSMDEDARRIAFYEKFQEGWKGVQERLSAA